VRGYIRGSGVREIKHRRIVGGRREEKRNRSVKRLTPKVASFGEYSVRVYRHQGAKEYDVNKIIQTLQRKVYRNLLRNVTEIHFVKGEPEPGITAKVESTFEGERITFGTGLVKAATLPKLIHHEMGHILHTVYLANIAMPKEWESIWRTECGQLTRYARKNPKEGFAEAWAMYVSPSGRKRLKKYAPRTFEAMSASEEIVLE